MLSVMSDFYSVLPKQSMSLCMGELLEIRLCANGLHRGCLIFPFKYIKDDLTTQDYFTRFEIVVEHHFYVYKPYIVEALNCSETSFRQVSRLID